MVGAIWAFIQAARGGFETDVGVCLYGGSPTTDGSCGGILLADQVVSWLAPVVFGLALTAFVAARRVSFGLR